MPPWLSDRRPQWLLEVTDWLTGALGSLRLGSIVGIAPVRERPWGAVLRVTASDRVVYFKAEGLGGHHEPAVLAELAHRWPDLVPDVLAADTSRSWLLMADHGRPMWDVRDTSEQVATLERVLPQYAELQAATARSVDVWLDAGAPDRRILTLPGLLDALLNGQLPGGALPFDADQRRAIDRLLPDFAGVCDGLATTPDAAALDHGDLHGGNILVGAGHERLADWGDSCVTHPFSSLLVMYQLTVNRFDRANRRAAGLRLRDAYLEGWSGPDQLPELRQTFTLALWAGYVTRALDFASIVAEAEGALVKTWQGHIVGVLSRWQETHRLLGQPEEFLLAIEP